MNFQVKCISSNDHESFTVGKIYTIINGYLKDDNGTNRPALELPDPPIRTFADLQIFQQDWGNFIFIAEIKFIVKCTFARDERFIVGKHYYVTKDGQMLDEFGAWGTSRSTINFASWYVDCNWENYAFELVEDNTSETDDEGRTNRMLYNIGDKILIRSDLIPGQSYDNVRFAPDMTKYLGKVIEIEYVYEDESQHYSAEGWRWSNAMIAGKVDDVSSNAYPTFRVRCIDNSGCGFTKDKIYTVENGILPTENGTGMRMLQGIIAPFKDIDDLNSHYVSKFVLVDEEQNTTESNKTYFKILTSTYLSHFIPGDVYIHENDKITVAYNKTLYGNLEYICNTMKQFCTYKIITEEEYKKYTDPKNLEYAAERLSYSLEHAFKELIEKEQAELKRIQMNYQNIKSNLNQTYENLKVQEELIKSLSGNKSFKENILKELTKINASKFCELLKIENNNISIYTTHLYITEPNTGRRYDLGEMKFSIPIDKEQPIVIENLTRRVCGYSDNMHHPHIFYEGDACWGDADCQIATYRAENEYYALFTTIINFCQTCDIDDCAGWYVSCWDEVDDNNQVIIKGHKPHCDEYDGYGCHDSSSDLHECEICGFVCEEDEMYYCSECDGWFCEDHAQYYDDIDATLCDNCLNKNYSTCTDCNRLTRTDNMIETENGFVCESCADKFYIECEECGLLISDENDVHLCNNCLENQTNEEESEEEGSVA